jgi:hypothetical protein
MQFPKNKLTSAWFSAQLELNPILSLLVRGGHTFVTTIYLLQSREVWKWKQENNYNLMHCR